MGSILSKLKAGADKEAKEAKEEGKKSFVKAVKAWSITAAAAGLQPLYYIMIQHSLASIFCMDGLLYMLIARAQ